MAYSSPRLRLHPRFETATGQRPIAKGEAGRAVEILQQCLVDLGSRMPNSTNRSGLTDGIFGPETEATVKLFQRTHGLAADGMVGPKTLARLDALLVAREHLVRLAARMQRDMPPPGGPCIAT